MKTLRAYGAIVRVQALEKLAYPADLASRAVTISIFLWIFIQLWRAVYASKSGAAVAGLSLEETLWYLAFTESLVLSRPYTSYAVAEAVKDGSVAYALCKPYSFTLYRMSVDFGQTLVAFVVNLAAAFALTYAYTHTLPPLEFLPLALVAALLGWLILFLANMLIGTIAFVAEEISAYQWIFDKLQLVLGGVMFPLAFFPDWLRKVAETLPFAQAIAGPAMVFAKPTLPLFGQVAAGQLVWALILGLMLAAVNRAVASRLVINGG